MAKEERIRDAFSPLLDGELSGEEREAVEADLAQEAELLRELEDFRRVDGLYKRLGRTAAPEDFVDRLRTAMAQGAGEEPAARTVPFRRWIVPLLAAAACLIAVSAAVLRGMGGQEPLDESYEMAAADRAEENFDATAAVRAEAPPAPDALRAQGEAEAMKSAEASPAAESPSPSLYFGAEADSAPPPAPAASPPAAPPPPAAEPQRLGIDEIAGREMRAMSGSGGGSVPAEANAAAEEAPTLQAGSLRFRFESGRWVEASYAGEAAEPIDRSDPKWRALAPEIRAALELQPYPIVLPIEGAWRVSAPPAP